MSSEQRSNSAVRNLRSLFENKVSEGSSTTRGRSPGDLSNPDTPRPTSTVRSSFIPVEPVMADINPSESTGNAGDVPEGINEAVPTEHTIEEAGSGVASVIPDTAVESTGPTSASEENKKADAKETVRETEDKQAENPDKHVTGAEEEPAAMRPADPANEVAVSGGESLPPVAEDLRKDRNVPSSERPSSISVKGKPTGSLKSPVRSPLSPRTGLPKKPSRSSLTAPTAASVARAAAASEKNAPLPKPKPREATRPADVSSRLTAPTAASRARLESNTASAPSSGTRAAGAPTTKPAPPTVRSTPRSSLAGQPKKAPGAVDGGFLDRMTRPTAASTNRVHEKPEVKSVSRQKHLPSRPKVNGHAKPADVAPAAEPEAAESVVADAPVVEDTLIEPESGAAPAEHEAEATAVDGNETPLAHPDTEDAATLEATPAAIVGEDSIR